MSQSSSVYRTVTSLAYAKFFTRITPVTTKFSHAMFSRQTFWLCTRSMKSSVREGTIKHGFKHIIRLIRRRFPFISQQLSFHTPTMPHKLSSLLHGVIVFTNSSFNPTRSAKLTLFSRDVGLDDLEAFTCTSAFMTKRALNEWCTLHLILIFAGYLVRWSGGWKLARMVDNFVLVGSDDIGPVPLSEK